MKFRNESGDAQDAGLAPVNFPVWLKAGFGVCLAIAVAVVLRRAFALLTPENKNAPPDMVQLDAWFNAHATITWIHILSALAFVTLLPFIFRSREANSNFVPKAFFVLGALTGLTAYGMSRYSVGGWLERSAVLVFDTLFLASLIRAWVFDRDGDFLNARIWMVRAVAILLGIATTRPVMGVFFATERISHLKPQQFFGIAFWIGFSINTIVIEFWLRRLPGQRLRT